MSKDWYRNGWNRNNLLFTSGDRERSLGQGITNCVYTNNRFDLQSKIHATQSDLCLLILSTSLLVDICRSGAVTQDFILSRWGRRRSFLSLFNLWATLLSPLSGSKFLEWQGENRRTSGTMYGGPQVHTEFQKVTPNSNNSHRIQITHTECK